MVEPVMYLAIGFLVAMLLGLMAMPLVHNRAVRLTTKRLEALNPMSMAEIQADRDQLRAGFAVNLRRLETSVERYRNTTSQQLAEIGRKSDAVNRLKQAMIEKDEIIAALQTHPNALEQRLLATEEEFALKVGEIRTTEASLQEKTSSLARVTAELTDRAMEFDTRQVELAALNTQMATLRLRAEDAEHDVTKFQAQLASQREQSETDARELAEWRERAAQTGEQVAGLERKLAAERQEADTLRSRINALEGQLAAQNDMLAGHRKENRELLEQIKAEHEQRRQERAKAGSNTGVADPGDVEAALAEQLRHVENERDGLKRDLESVRQTARISAAEQAENALLRERINAIAAEVTRLAITLEGPQSSIQAMLADDPAAGTSATVNGTSAKGSATSSTASLAERIRALQTQAARAARTG
jgi:chromosome segregation ATPase